MARLLAVATAFAIASTIAASPALAQSTQASAGCAGQHAAERFVATFPVDNVQRTALVNVPAVAQLGQPLPVVFMFHGAGGNAAGTESSTGMTQVATRFGYIIVYPNANGKYWNLNGGGSQGNDDVEFVSELLDQLEAVLCIDQSHVYAAGGSNGGGFVSRLGCEINDRLAGIAPVAGLYGREPTCEPKHPISVLEIHGTADQTVPYDGWVQGNIASVESFLIKWNGWDDCAPGLGAWRRLAPGALWVAKTGCAGGTTVAHIKLRGEPHAWPTSAWYPTPHHTQGVAFDASTAIFQFFSAGTVLPQTPPRRRAPVRRH